MVLAEPLQTFELATNCLTNAVKYLDRVHDDVSAAGLAEKALFVGGLKAQIAALASAMKQSQLGQETKSVQEAHTRLRVETEHNLEIAIGAINKIKDSALAGVAKGDFDHRLVLIQNLIDSIRGRQYK